MPVSATCKSKRCAWQRFERCYKSGNKEGQNRTLCCRPWPYNERHNDQFAKQWWRIEWRTGGTANYHWHQQVPVLRLINLIRNITKMKVLIVLIPLTATLQIKTNYTCTVRWNSSWAGLRSHVDRYCLLRYVQVMHAYITYCNHLQLLHVIQHQTWIHWRPNQIKTE